MTEGSTNQMDWRAGVVEDTILEIILLLGDDGGWNSSLIRGSVDAFVASGVIPTLGVW
jgi:hypothetical protein